MCAMPDKSKSHKELQTRGNKGSLRCVPDGGGVHYDGHSHWHGGIHLSQEIQARAQGGGID